MYYQTAGLFFAFLKILWPEKIVVKTNQTELCKMCNDNLLLESVTRHKFKNEVDKQNVSLGCGVLA